MSIVMLEAVTRLIVNNESEILIPRKLRTHMMDILHYTHCGDEAMLRKCKRKIFWPGMKKDLKQKYEECNSYQENIESSGTK